MIVEGNFRFIGIFEQRTLRKWSKLHLFSAEFSKYCTFLVQIFVKTASFSCKIIIFASSNDKTRRVYGTALSVLYQ